MDLAHLELATWCTFPAANHVGSGFVLRTPHGQCKKALYNGKTNLVVIRGGLIFVLQPLDIVQTSHLKTECVNFIICLVTAWLHPLVACDDRRRRVFVDQCRWHGNRFVKKWCTNIFATAVSATRWMARRMMYGWSLVVRRPCHPIRVHMALMTPSSAREFFGLLACTHKQHLNANENSVITVQQVQSFLFQVKSVFQHFYIQHFFNVLELLS